MSNCNFCRCFLKTFNVSFSVSGLLMYIVRSAHISKQLFKSSYFYLHVFFFKYDFLQFPFYNNPALFHFKSTILELKFFFPNNFQQVLPTSFLRYLLFLLFLLLESGFIAALVRMLTLQSSHHALFRGRVPTTLKSFYHTSVNFFQVLFS